MLIKVDCREKEIYTKITKIGSESKKTNTKSKSELLPLLPPPPRFHMIDLGDGMTIQVPLPASIDHKVTRSKGSNKSLEHEENIHENVEEKETETECCQSRHKILSVRMPIGDMSIERENADHPSEIPDILFERKTLYDLAASIKDGRYKEQSFRLETTLLHNHNIVYIIEGDLSKYDEKKGRISKTAIQSAMVSLLYYKGFSVYRTMNTDETAAFIVNFADKIEGKDKDKDNGNGNELGYYCRRSGKAMIPESESIAGELSKNTNTQYSEVVVKKEKRDFITQDNIGTIMLSNIPGVSPKIAAAIMKKYNNSMFEFLDDLKRKNDIFEESSSKTKKTPIPSKILAECFADIEIHGAKGDNGIDGNTNSAVLEDEIEKECGSNNSTHQIRKIGKATIDKIYKFLCR